MLLVNSLEHYTRHQTPPQGLLAVVFLLYLHPKGVLIAPLCRCHGVGLHLRGQRHAKRMACFPFQPGATLWRDNSFSADMLFVLLCFSLTKHAEGHFSALTCTFELFCARKDILQDVVKTRFQHGSEECCNDVAYQRMLERMEHQSSYRCQLFCNHGLLVNMQIRMLLLSISIPHVIYCGSNS